MTRRHARLLCLSLAALLILLAACGEDDFGSDPATATPEPEPTATVPASPTPEPDPTATTSPDETPLVGSEWILTQLNGSPALTETQINLEFRDDGAGGYSGCNWYGGHPEISGNSIRFGDISMTLRLCHPESLVEQEQRYHDLLRTVEHFEIVGTTLSMSDASGATTLVFERREVATVDPSLLIDTTWLLVEFNDGEAAGPPGLLTFEDESSFTTRDGCYNYSGSYTTDGDKLSMPASEANAHACLQPLDVQTNPANLANAMGGVAWYRLDADASELELLHYDGSVARFTRVTDLPADDAWAVTWQLQSIVAGGHTESLIAATEITLHLANPSLQLNEPQPIRGNSGCNTYQASILAGVDDFTFTDIMVTEMGCVEPAGVMEQEQRFLELLGAVTSHNVYEENTLQLTTADGTTLVFHPQD